jgi:hypothetical protein
MHKTIKKSSKVRRVSRNRKMLSTHSPKGIIKKKSPGLGRKKRRIPKAVRDKVWNHYVGIEKGISKCLCCQNQQISQNNFECGHVVAESKGGRETIINLRPVCGLCNKSMGNTNMVKFMHEHGYKIDHSFHGRYEALRELFPNGYYYCNSCGNIQGPPNSWFQWPFYKCKSCSCSVTRHSTAYLLFF